MRMILLALSFVLTTAAHAETCRGELAWDGSGAAVGTCRIPIGEMHTQITKVCHWGQSCEVRAEVIRGEITKIYSIPTARQVCTGNRLEVIQGIASIQSGFDARRDPTACSFKVDSEIGQHIFDACLEALTSEPHYGCWIRGDFVDRGPGKRELIRVFTVVREQME
jgi:hypothetical protein